MENIINAAKQAVSQAKSMIEYYEKKVEEYKSHLGDAKQKAEALENEFNELVEKLK